MLLPFFKKKTISHSERTAKVFISPGKNQSLVIFGRTLLAIVITFLVICCLYFFFRSDIFKIREISLEKQDVGNKLDLLMEDTLKTEMQDWSSYSIFTFPQKKEEQRLQNKFLVIQKLQIKRELPNKLVVIWQERRQAAIVKAENGEFVLDDQGLIFALNQPGINVPLFEDLGKQFALEQSINSENLDFALKTVFRFSEVALKPTKFSFLENDVLQIQTEQNVECFFTSQKNLDLQIETLQVVLKDAKIEGKNYKKIDLRFERPVVIED